MATHKVRPEPGFVDRQFVQQRKRTRNRKLGAVALATVIGLIGAVVVIRAMDEGAGTQPGGRGTDPGGTQTGESIPPVSEGIREPGRYLFTSNDPGLDASHRISIDVPDGYRNESGHAVVKLGSSQTAVGTMAIEDVYANACQWEGTLLDRSAISSPEGVAAALASQEGLRVSTPTDVTVDGFAGTYMERRVPATTSLADCDLVQFRVYEVPGWGERNLAPGLLQQLWILDIDGVPLVIEASVEQGTPAEVRAELLQMVESIQIDPR